MPASLRSRRANSPWCSAAVASRLGIGGLFARNAAVADDQQRRPVADRLLARLDQLVQRRAQALARAAVAPETTPAAWPP